MDYQTIICSEQTFSSSLDDPRYNLASELYSDRWEEGLYRLYETGHCHTFNPENVSLAGLQGQHYFNLGLHNIINCFNYKFDLNTFRRGRE